MDAGKGNGMWLVTGGVAVGEACLVRGAGEVFARVVKGTQEVTCGAVVGRDSDSGDAVGDG